MTRSLTKNFLLPNNWITNITSLIVSDKASDKATHSASELDSVTLFWTFNCQDTGTPNSYWMQPFTILLLTRYPCIVTITEADYFPWFIGTPAWFKLQTNFFGIQYIPCMVNPHMLQSLHHQWLLIVPWLCWQYLIWSASYKQLHT